MIGLVARPRGKRSARLISIDRTPPPEDPHPYYADFIENNERHRHEQLIDHIRGGGEDGGDDKGKEKGVFAVTGQKGMINDAEAGEQHHEHRHFKRHPKGDEQPQAERKIFLDRGQGGEKIGGVAHEKTESGRKDDVIAEGGPAEEAEGGKEGEGDDHPLFMLIETRGDKDPDLPEDHRAGQENAADQGELQIKKKASW